MKVSLHSVLWLGCLVFATGASAATLSLVPNPSTVAPGSSVSIDVVIAGLGDSTAPSVGAFDLDVLYDPSLFTLTSVSFSDGLGDEGLGEVLTGSSNGVTSVNAFAVSLLTAAELNGAQPDTFTLMTLEFDAIAAGAGTFDAMVNAVGDENGAPLAVTAITPAQVISGFANVPSIPTLETWMLLLMAAVLAGAGLVMTGRV